MPQITFSVARLHFSRAKTGEMLPQSITNQRRSIDMGFLGGSIGGPKQRRIENDLNGFHAVESTPQQAPQSILGDEFGCPC